MLNPTMSVTLRPCVIQIGDYPNCGLSGHPAGLHPASALLHCPLEPPSRRVAMGSKTNTDEDANTNTNANTNASRPSGRLGKICINIQGYKNTNANREANTNENENTTANVNVRMKMQIQTGKPLTKSLGEFHAKSLGKPLGRSLGKSLRKSLDKFLGEPLWQIPKEGYL